MKKGFTLVEMIVVIAIIGVLTAIVVTGLVGSKAKARDGQRASDLSQISLALEQYFDRCDQYPATIYPASGQTLASIYNGCPMNGATPVVTLANFISQMPTDPSGSGSPLKNADYGYAVNNSSQPTDYVLYTIFETTNSVLAQSAPAPTSWLSTFNTESSSFNCGNQATSPIVANGLDYCVRPN
jgi:type II secretion system protein G